MSDPPRSALAGLRVAYVVQLYPKVSHVFIQREVAALRAAGADVDTYSLQTAGASEVLSGQDREEAARTTSLRPVDAATVLQVHLRALIRNPRAYVATLASALSAAPRGVKARIWQVFYFAQAVLLLDRLRRREARHVHAHLANVATDVAWFAVELANRSGSERWTWSFTMHGPTEFHAVERFNLARKVAAADLVVCISDFCRSQLMAITDPSTWSKLKIVHCGVDLDRAPIDRGQRGSLHLLSIGRLVPEKAQSLILEVVAELVRRGHAVTATIVGAGPDHERLVMRCAELGIASRVELPGAVGQDDLVECFERADMFVMASFDEGVPVVLMEAMASGLPVIATRVAGVPELIDDGISGLLVAPGRVDQLVDAVERLSNDPWLRASLSKAGRATVEQRFDAAAEAIELGLRFRGCTSTSAQEQVA